MPLRRVCTIAVGVVSLILATAKYPVVTIHAGQGFPPISPEELKITSEPLAPGAPAVILYRQVDRDDNGRTSHEDNFVRIKILTEEGRKNADIEIPFAKGTNDVVHLHGRTIRPDGSIAEFDGKVYEKTIVKARGLKYLTKTFTLPDVQVGGIIEYSFTYDFKEYALYDSPLDLKSGFIHQKREVFAQTFRWQLRESFCRALVVAESAPRYGSAPRDQPYRSAGSP